MEDSKMADRIQLNDQEMEDVTGGKFSFFTDEDGKMKCRVTGYGVFETTDQGFYNYISVRRANPGLTEADYFRLCMEQHVIW